MREARFILQLAVAIALPLVGVSCRAAGQVPNAGTAQDRTADEAAIRAQIAANEAAYNNRDAAGVAATYAPDGDHIAFSSPRRTGREAIRRLLEDRWSRSFVEVKVPVDTIRFLSPDVAIAEITAQFANGSSPRGTLVMVRADDTWLIAAGRFFSAQQ